MRRLLAITLLFQACDRAQPSTQPDDATAATASTDPTDPTEATDVTDAPSPQTDPPATEPEPEPAPEPPADPYGPLAGAIQADLAAIPSDPEPTELTRNSHYWVSNERSHFLWHERLQGIGDAFVGVGTDQNYMLAAWAKSDLIILMDFDQAIANIHQVYKVLFAAADTPERFVALWSADEEDAVRAMLEAEFSEEQGRKRIVRAHKIARKLVHSRLRRLVRQYGKLGMPTFVSDQGEYDHIRTLWRNGRVVAMRGDLTASETLRGIGNVLRKHGLEIGVLYTSNAEQYFDYLPDFRRNILSLPFADDSLVLRTLGWSVHGFVEGEEYHYNSQSGANFTRWMETNRIQRSGRILRHKQATEIEGSSVIVEEPEPSDPAPTIAPETAP